MFWPSRMFGVSQIIGCHVSKKGGFLHYALWALLPKRR